MTPPTSILLTACDLDLLDWLIKDGDQPNRTAMIHFALVHYGRTVGAPPRLLHAATREREERGSRKRVRSGTAKMRADVFGEDDGSAA